MMKSDGNDAPFAYGGLDRVIHEKARLGVMTSLMVHPKGLAFADLRQLCGLTAPNMERLQEELAEAIQIFEPRIISRGLAVHADMERNVVTFDVQGDLWANPLPEHLHVKTSVDIENGQCVLGDSSHG